MRRPGRIGASTFVITDHPCSFGNRAAWASGELVLTNFTGTDRGRGPFPRCASGPSRQMPAVHGVPFGQGFDAHGEHVAGAAELIAHVKAATALSADDASTRRPAPTSSGSGIGVLVVTTRLEAGLASRS